MGDAFDDLDAVGKEMEALEAGTLTPPAAQPPAPPPPEPPPVAAPAASPVPQPDGTTPPVAPAEPFVFPATREEYERAMNPPPPEPAAPPPPAAPAAPVEPAPGQAVPWQRFEEVRQAAAKAQAQLDMLLRLNMNPQAQGQPPAAGAPDPRIPKEYDPKIASLVDPVMDVRMEQERAKIIKEIEARYEPILAKQRVETFIDNVDAALGTPPGSPGFRAVYPQVNAYFESLPPEQREPYASVVGAIALKTIMEARGLLQPVAPVAGAPPPPPRYVGPAPVLDPSTARAHMELRPGREPSRPIPLSGDRAALAINSLSPEAFEALKESWCDGKRPESAEPDAFLR